MRGIRTETIPLTFWLAGAALAAFPLCAHADETKRDDTKPDDTPIVVYGRGLQQVGSATSGSQGVVGYADFENRPIGRVGELAENVPGLIATQHSGEGKANQYFLRGFNLDHGTDLAGFVDGAPVNMRTHGHGQGYLDLNFLIPELVERIDYTKGPYHADLGDFASAGSLAFTTKDRLARPMVEVSGGSFGYVRGLVAGSGQVAGGTLLGAFEGTRADGPWVLSEQLAKFNALIKYSRSNWSLGLSAYTNHWRSTDQVPERAVQSGLIPLNGFIDPNDGGRAGRIALNFNGHFGRTTVSAYAIGSRLQLTSDFTYFLDDPVNGDGFRQVDRRGVFGGSIRHEWGDGPLIWRIGADTRWDHIGQVGLFRTSAGTVTGTVRNDRVDEYSGGFYGEGEWHIRPTLRLVLGLRGDVIGYRVRSDLAANSGTGSAALASPKVALAWQPSKGIELYADYGEGYHSNDVRGATITIDPTSHDAVGRVPVMAKSRGAELGARIERKRITASLVGFWLDLASELVFTGDEGTTEPNAATRRFGTELSIFWRPVEGVTIDSSLAYTHARFRGVTADQTYIPNATPFVLSGGISGRITSHLNATLRLRHFAGAPLIEDSSQRSAATTLVNAGLYWDRGSWRVSADLLNLFNAHDPDISYWYTSRLPGEPAEGVADRHIHPVEPRQVRVTLRYSL
ncbi:TonB-dependent receptor, putative [Novosphingobium nitrogenifigens DSM 19370]|uniref:TonB-dependent receptor, putative n=1 Tax=Novosphingobium nitrogenifigens DSM 19370 TaxID=983920 RepID=F1Z385_9SPHN|nr:TonB-dependent receptor [Novosphingobium nitrogenifigens]EGD60928.1 TonB-dependent receptor, putative [Novosphingobium nitrogenifigens DSM 19370]